MAGGIKKDKDNIKTSSQLDNELAQQTKEFKNAFLNSPLSDIENLDKWFKDNKDNNFIVSSIDTVFSSPNIKQKLESYEKSLNTIANMSVAIVSAIYAQRIRDNVKSDSLNFQNIDISKSPFEQKELIQLFQEKSSDNVFNSILKKLNSVNNKLSKNNSTTKNVKTTDNVINTASSSKKEFDFDRLYSTISELLAEYTSDITSRLDSLINPITKANIIEKINNINSSIKNIRELDFDNNTTQIISQLSEKIDKINIPSSVEISNFPEWFKIFNVNDLVFNVKDASIITTLDNIVFPDSLNVSNFPTDFKISGVTDKDLVFNVKDADLIKLLKDFKFPKSFEVSNISNIATILQDIDNKVKSINIESGKSLFTKNIEIGIKDDTLKGLKDIYANNVKIAKTKTEGKDLMSSLLDSLAAISDFDSRKLRNVRRNIRKLLKLFIKPNSAQMTLVRMGLSSTGAIYTIINSISEASVNAKSSTNAAKNIAAIFDGVLKTMQLDRQELRKLKLTTKELVLFFGPAKDNEYNFDAFLNNINKILLRLNRDRIANAEKDIKNFISLITYLVKLAEFDYKKSVKNITQLPAYVNSIQETIDNIKKIDFNNFKNFIVNVSDISKLLSESNKYNLLAKVGAKGIKSIIAEIGLLSKEITKLKSLIQKERDLAPIKKFIDDSLDIAKTLALGGVIAFVAIPGIVLFRYTLKWSISSLIKDVSELAEQIGENSKSLDSIRSFLLATAGIMLIGAAFMLIPPLFAGAMAFTGAFTLFLLSITVPLTLMSMMFKDNTAFQNAKDMGTLVAILGGIMLAGSLVMMIPGITKHILDFTLYLSGFLLGIGSVLGLISLFLNGSAFENAKDMGTLVAILGGIMLAGALFMYIPGIMENILKFTGGLALFITATIGILALISYGLEALGGEEIFKQINSLGKLIVMLGATMIIGASLMFIPGMFENAMKFTGAMALFVLSTVGIIGLVTALLKDGENVKSILWSFAGIIVLLSGIMLGAAYLMAKNPGVEKQLLWFVGATLLLVGGIAFILYLVNKSLSPEKLKGMLLALIGISVVLVATGFTLLVLAEVYKKVNEAGNIITFGIFLAEVGAVLYFAFKLINKIGSTFEKNRERLLWGAIGLTVISLELWLVGKAFEPITSCYDAITSKGNVLGFGIFLAEVGAVLLGAIEMVKHLGKVYESSADKVTIGFVMLATLSGELWLLGKAMEPIVDCYSKVQGSGGIWEFAGFLAEVGVVLVAAAGAVIGLGALMTTGVGAVVFAAGAAALAGLAGAMWTVGEALVAIANAKIAIKSAGGLDPSEFKQYMQSLKAIMDSMEDLTDKRYKKIAKDGSKVVKYMSNAISDMSEAIQAYANLTVNEYDDSGKQTGSRRINENDFNDAAKNISKIVLTVGATLISLYTAKNLEVELWDNKKVKITSAAELFEPNFMGLGTSPFYRIIKSVSSMGNMISKIAEGVQTYANLRIPTYDKSGKVTGSRPLNENDFKDAAKNISRIILTIGASLISLYNGNIPDSISKDLGGITISANDVKSMFKKEWSIFGDSPFEIVLGATSKMGDMISNISKGVIDFASGKIPSGWDKEGNPTSWKGMEDIKMENIASNIGLIVTAIGSALIKIHEDPKNAEIFFGGENSRVMQISKAISNIGQGISNIADVAIKFASGNIPKAWDGEGKPTEFWGVEGIKSLFGNNIEELKTKAWYIGLQSMIMAVPQAINEVYQSEKKGLFDEGFWGNSNSAYQIMTDSLAKSGELISSILTAFMEVNEKLGVSTDANGETVAKVNVVYLKNAIMNMIEALPSALFSAAYTSQGKLKAYFKSEEEFNKIKNVLTNIRPVIDSASKLFIDLYKSELMKITNINDIASQVKRAILNSSVMAKDIKDNQSSLANIGNVENIVNSINSLRKTTLTILSLYKTIYNETAAGYINSGEANLKSLFEGLGKISITAPPAFFANYCSTYGEGIASILKVFENRMPTNDEADSVAYAIREISKEASTVGDPTNFVVETISVKDFVTSVNRIDINKTNSMTELLKAMKENIEMQNSNKFQQLFNRLVEVIDTLANELVKTSSTLNRTEEVQRHRQELLSKTAEQLKEMINKPIEVTVKEDDSNSLENENSGSSLKPSRSQTKAANPFSQSKLIKQFSQLMNLNSNSEIKTV